MKPLEIIVEFRKGAGMLKQVGMQLPSKHFEAGDWRQTQKMARKTETSRIPSMRSVGAIRGEGLVIVLKPEIGGVIRNLDMPTSVFLISGRGSAD